MFLQPDVFQTVIESTPLISIDLVVENSAGETLLGYRNNRPAKGFWFVPGGRVRKNEGLDQAFLRLCQEELGLTVERSSALFMGPFEHFYKDCVFGQSASTHYVVLAYKLTLEANDMQLPNVQHSQYCWMTPQEILERDDVHTHTKWYITKN